MGVYFQGNNQLQAGLGNLIGGGLRCAGGGVIHLQYRLADAQGNSATTLNVSIRGGVDEGNTKHYQYWYRDDQGPCGSSFNLTNGLSITWGV